MIQRNDLYQDKADDLGDSGALERFTLVWHTI